jgi:hypothetical protein
MRSIELVGGLGSSKVRENPSLCAVPIASSRGCTQQTALGVRRVTRRNPRSGTKRIGPFPWMADTEHFKSSASAIPRRRLLRRSIDRQEMPQKERAGPARPVGDRRWSDSQSIGPERWNSNPSPARTSPRRTCTGVRALRRPRPRDPARRRCPCSDRAARPAFPDTCRPAVGRGKPPDSCLGGWRSRIPGCPTRRRGAA